jgi:hypothetical protein
MPRIAALTITLGLLWLPSMASAQGNTKKAAPAAKNPAPKAGTSSKAADFPQGDRRLTLDQVRQLVTIRTPDNAIAQEIQSRGLNADFTRKDIEELRQLGA